MSAADRIRDAMLRRLAQGPVMFLDLVEAFPDEEYREILRAWSAVRETAALDRTEEGHYLLRRAG